MSDDYPVQRLCELFAVSRSGYYTWRKGAASPRARHDAALAIQIAAVHAKSRGTYGSPRVTLDLQEAGERVGRHRVARLMRRAGLRGRQKRRYRVVTTDSRHGEPIAPNRLAAITPPTKPDRVWLTDLMPAPGLCRVGASGPSAGDIADAA